jgi:hypothetical protein
MRDPVAYPSPNCAFTSELSSIELSGNNQTIDFTNVYAFTVENVGTNPLTIEIGKSFKRLLNVGDTFSIPYMAAPFSKNTNLFAPMEGGATILRVLYFQLKSTNK